MSKTNIGNYASFYGVIRVVLTGLGNSRFFC